MARVHQGSSKEVAIYTGVLMFGYPLVGSVVVSDDLSRTVVYGTPATPQNPTMPVTRITSGTQLSFAQHHVTLVLKGHVSS